MRLAAFRLLPTRKNGAQLQELVNSERNTQRASFLRRFAVKTRDRVAFVRSEEIDWIEATGDYAGLHVGNKTYLIRTSINELARRLDPTAFTRVHRSAIVQLDRIVRIAPVLSGDARLTLSTGDEVRVSRNFSKPLRKILCNGNPVVRRADRCEAGIHKVFQ